MNTYQVKLLDGLVNLNTLSPNKKFFYKISYPVELNMGNWGVRISFYDVNNDLIYFDKNSYAHVIGKANDFQFVLWSTDGNFVVYYSYITKFVGEFVCIDLKSKEVNKIVVNKETVTIFDEFKKKKFDKNSFLKEFQNNENKETIIIKDKVSSRTFFQKLLSYQEWYPKVN